MFRQYKQDKFFMYRILRIQSETLLSQLLQEASIKIPILVLDDDDAYSVQLAGTMMLAISMIWSLIVVLEVIRRDVSLKACLYHNLRENIIAALMMIYLSLVIIYLLIGKKGLNLDQYKVKNSKERKTVLFQGF